MIDPTPVLWLQTFMVMAGLGVGLILHLKWHPLREPLSDAWDMLQSFGWLVPILAALLLLSGSTDPWSIPQPDTSNGNLNAWDSLLEVLPFAARDMAMLTHGFLPPWPVALAMPLVMSLLAWRVKRFPYRYDSRRKRPVVLNLLITAVVLAWVWLGLEIAGWMKPMPEWLETLRLVFRWLAEALMMAGLQVYMIRLVMAWEDPIDPNDRHDLWLALEHALSRWRGIMSLAALDLLWLMAWRVLAGGQHWISEWLLLESTLLFATVPMVIAWQRGSWGSMIELMTGVFLKSFFSLLLFATTAIVLLMLVHFSLRGLFSLVPEMAVWTGLIRILFALVLATVRSWLFLAFVLTLLRHGLKAAAPLGQAH